MKQQQNLKLLIGSGIVGLVLGSIGGPVQILIIWGVIGLVIGYLSRNLRSAILHGAVYGFIVSFVFMLHGYNGIDPVAGKLVPFAILGAFGALCGITLALMGVLLRKLLRKNDAAATS